MGFTQSESQFKACNLIKPHFLSPTWLKLKNCSSERGLPEVFKTHPTFVPSVILVGVMASQT